MFKKGLWVAVLAAMCIAVGGLRTASAEPECKKMKGPEEAECRQQACIPCQRGECAGIYLGMADELGLSEDQVTKLKTIHVAGKKLKIQKKAEMEVILLEINSLLDEANPDQSKIDSQVEKLNQTKSELMKACLKGSVQARQVLTPEQFKQSKKMQKKQVCPMGDKPEAMPHHQM